MPYKEGNRLQSTFFPESIEDYVDSDDPVRFYDAFINQLSLSDLGIELKQFTTAGNISYHPATMLKILTYAYSYGINSSRKIERALHHNISFIWLAGGLKPDDKTISDFRRNNLTAFKKILQKSALVCKQLNLIKGNVLFIDGTKIRGNCSINNSRSEESLERQIANIDQRIEDIMAQIERTDSEESGSFVSMGEELSDAKNLKVKIEGALTTLKKRKIEDKNNNVPKAHRDIKKINLTDEEAVNFKSRQGYHTGYNVQSTVDGENGLIINVEAESRSTDDGTLDRQVQSAANIMGDLPEAVCADAGYSSPKDLHPVYEKGVKLIIPSKQQSYEEKQIKRGREKTQEEKDTEFKIDKFTYDSEQDIYICPEGNRLKKRKFSKHKKVYEYQIEQASLCRSCKFFGKCTNSKKSGRVVSRSIFEETKQKVALDYKHDENQEIYKQRKFLAERPFGHIKRNLNGGRFLLRGREGADGEASIFASCYNLVRMMNLLGGVERAIAAIQEINKEIAPINA